MPEAAGDEDNPHRVTIELDLARGWRLAGEFSAPAAAVAAAELEAALGPPGEEGVEIVLTHAGAGGEGFRRRATAKRVDLRGDAPQGLLYGTYALLEELGAGWPWPGERPVPAGGTRLDEKVEDTPALAGRALVLGERSLVEDAESWIVWAARHRLNCLFAHVSTRGDPTGAAPEAVWRERRERSVALARERGMTIEHGGHLLPELLPRRALQALRDGRPLGDAARGALEEHVAAHPEADVLHTWGADVPAAGGGQDASEAALRATNAVAEVVEEVRPGTQVAFLAYHDTLEVPRGVRPRHNVCLLFAPRERCYDHSLVDPGCSANAAYRESFLAQVEFFRAAAAAAPRVFEYWFDAILFGGEVPNLTGVMAADLDFYRDAGAHTVQMLMTGHGRPPSPHPNPAAFAQLCWDPGIESRQAA